MFKNILVPTDGSDFAAKAVEQAIRCVGDRPSWLFDSFDFLTSATAELPRIRYRNSNSG